jgi:DNA-binding transcriptional regulator YdaS (Cro superfamily)
MNSPGIAALKAAIEAAGGQRHLARLLSVSQPTVHGWLKTATPASRCAAIEAASGIRCEDLRPDLTWHRDADGTVTGYTTPVAPPAQSEAA